MTGRSRLSALPSGGPPVGLCNNSIYRELQHFAVPYRVLQHFAVAIPYRVLQFHTFAILQNRFSVIIKLTDRYDIPVFDNKIIMSVDLVSDVSG